MWKQTVRPKVNTFKKKYPHIKVKLWRGGNSRLVPRVLAEYRTKSHVVDIIELTQSGALLMKESRILQPFYSPNLVSIEEDAIKKATGEGVFSAGHYQNGRGLGYNTKLIKFEDLPKTYQDLLDPKWKGKLPIVGSNTGVTWAGCLLEIYGEDFVKKLSKQKFDIHMISARALLDMIIAGEYEFSPTIADSHVKKSKNIDAPVDWIPLEPAQSYLGSIMLPKHSPHPHPAMLFIDFDLSKEVGELYKATGYNSLHKDVTSERPYKKYYGPFNTKQVKKWSNLFNSLFLNK
ncbi:ABC transporter substrate-binding protein [Thermodesulfobacteriota bacterium]